MDTLRHLTVFLLAVIQFGIYCPDAMAEQHLSVRVDPAYFYTQKKPTESLDSFVTNLVTEIKTAGFDQIYVQAYSSTYGAFYPTHYSMTDVEKGLGQEDVLGKLVTISQSQGISVIATVPVNSFASVWNKNPSWRVKGPNGEDLAPKNDLYLLSTASGEYRGWYLGFVRDLIQHNPKLAGVEAVEPVIDVNWSNQADFHPQMKETFQRAHPNAPLSGSIWRQHVASSLTEFLASMFAEIKLHRMKAYVVQTWAANADGTLASSDAIRDGSGFDFNAIQNLPEAKRPDLVIVELIWQQWRALYDASHFDAHWTAQAIGELKARYKGPAPWAVHIETTSFKSSKKPERSIASLGSGFENSFQDAWKSGFSVDLYSYHLLKDADLLKRVPLLASH